MELVMKQSKAIREHARGIEMLIETVMVKNHVSKCPNVARNKSNYSDVPI